MGNETSTAQGKSGDGFPNSNGITASPATTRRIVKAVKPVPSPNLTMPSDDKDTKGSKGDDDDDDANIDHHKRHRRDLPLPVHESASVVREQALETLKEQKQERMETMKENQRARREKRLEERRQRNPGGNPNEASTLSSTDEHASVKPNPFSRFLSVFSVEPKYPEHKRSYEVSEDDEPEPEIKKPRAALAEEEEDASKKKSSSFLRNGVYAATAAAVVAFAAGALLRATRPKN